MRTKLPLMLIGEKNRYKIDDRLIINNEQIKIAKQLLSVENIKIFNWWYFKFKLYFIIKIILIIAIFATHIYLYVSSNIPADIIKILTYSFIALLIFWFISLFLGQGFKNSYFIALASLNCKAYYILETGEEIYDEKDLEFMKNYSITMKMSDLNYQTSSKLRNPEQRVKRYLFWNEIDTKSFIALIIVNMILVLLLLFAF